MKHFFKHFAIAAVALFLMGRCVYYKVQCSDGYGPDATGMHCEDHPWNPFD